MYTELPLSTRTCLVLKPSIMSIMIRGSSCGYFTPRVSSPERPYLSFPFFGVWMGVLYGRCLLVSTVTY